MSNCNKEILDLLADGFKSDQTIVGLSDIYAHLLKLFEKPYSSKVYLPEDIEYLLNNQHKPYNKSGLLNWMNFYKPYQGSDKFINFLLKITKVDSKIVPWYETSNPTNTFDLTLDKFPKDIDLNRFINLINTYKNIESKLASMRTGFCPNRFTLDVSLLDYDILSDTSGVDIDGVTYCFGVKRAQQVIVPTPKVYQFLTEFIYSRYLYANLIILDEWILGDRLIALINPNNNRVSYKTYTGKLSNHNTTPRTWVTGNLGWSKDKSWSSPYTSSSSADYTVTQSDYFRQHMYFYYTNNNTYVAHTGSGMRSEALAQYVTDIANSVANRWHSSRIINGQTSLYPKWNIPNVHTNNHNSTNINYKDVSSNVVRAYAVTQNKARKAIFARVITQNIKSYSFINETSGYGSKVILIKPTWKTGGSWTKGRTWEFSVVNCFTAKT
nr:MAG TPA: hypothetical protein [Bacteriophage sp.]